jgi:hypothetical protein
VPISGRLAIGTSVASLCSLVNEDCGPPDCFSQLWPEHRDKLKASPAGGLGAVDATPTQVGSHPVSDRMWSENRMANDSKSAAPKQKSSRSSMTCLFRESPKFISQKRRECRAIGASNLVTKQKEL